MAASVPKNIYRPRFSRVCPTSSVGQFSLHTLPWIKYRMRVKLMQLIFLLVATLNRIIGFVRESKKKKKKKK
jgi:hypothetical protein